jgi:acetyl esterase/lipase
MKPGHYPPQEPLSEAGQKYGDECLRRSAGIAFEEARYGDDPYQSVAVFPAREPTGTVLLFWHGGGWTSGYKEWFAFMAPALNAAGITFVSAGYRLAPQHVFPAGFDDCARAVAWTHANIGRYGGDPKKLFIGGHSSGAHYAALLAARRDWPARHGLPADVVKGALPVSGTYWFTEGSGLAMRPRFLGADAANDRAASPIHQLQPPLPPMFLALGTADFPHLVKQAEAFEAAVRAAGGEVERLAMPDRNHFTASYATGEADGPWVPRAVDFMRRHA